jgi:1-deoxy-D-xylulose-5-phosphate synthase
VFDIAFLRCVPNMVIMMPKDEDELQHMLYTAILYDDGPIAVRFPRGSGVGVQMAKEFKALPIGRAEVLREGSDMALLAFGNMVPLAERAAEQLVREGISPRVINARFAKPLDESLLLQIAEEGIPVLTVEEGCLIGGFGSAVLEFYAEQGIHDMVVERLAVPDRFIEHGSVEQLRREIGLTVDHIVQKGRSIMPRKRRRA